MTAKSKEKGARFERLLVHLLSEYGYEVRRTAQYCGNTGDAADVEGLPYIHIEAKHQEQARFYDFMEQAVNDSQKSGRIPTVFYKKNNHEILVIQRFDDWMKLYQVYESFCRNMGKDKGEA